MSTGASLLTLVLSLVMGILPCHRCAPAGCGGETTVLVGSHAHDDHRAPARSEGDHAHPDGCPCGTRAPGDSTDGSNGSKDGSKDGSRDDEPCCTDSASDAGSSAPRAAVPEVVPSQPTGTALAHGGSLAVRSQRPGTDVPVPRRPTETVALLR